MGSALAGPRCTLYLFSRKGCRCHRYFGHACRSGSLSFHHTNMPRSKTRPAVFPQHRPNRSVPLRYASRFYAPIRLAGTCFLSLMYRLPFVSIKPDFQTIFSFLTAKVKPPAPPSRVHETPHQAWPLTTSHRAFIALALKN